jgi:hypothetical protein
MHAVTIRRLIVFGVCALGVGSLYLVPGVARSPEQIRRSGLNEEPTNSVAGIRRPDSEESASSTGARTSVPGNEEAPGKTRSGADPSQSAATRAKDSSDEVDGRPLQKRRTDQPKARKDSEPPQPVSDLEPLKVSPKQLTINWSAATDNVGVIGYRIWLNGFEVATTADTRARLRWFNDDGGQHVVQIRAVDAAGNQSRSSPTLVVTRPSTEPTDTPTPEAPDSPTPRDEPSHPSGQSVESSSRTPTEEDSTRTPTEEDSTNEDEHR